MTHRLLPACNAMLFGLFLSTAQAASRPDLIDAMVSGAKLTKADASRRINPAAVSLAAGAAKAPAAQPLLAVQPGVQKKFGGFEEIPADLRLSNSQGHAAAALSPNL